MRLPPQKLLSQLNKKLSTAYLIFGDEPLQIRESVDTVRSAARRGGFDERLVFDVDATFDWNLLRCEMDSLSLFASQRLIELRMPGGKPGK
ncbi:MAG: DNA polymerase III subunit delta, partial [Gammaproteobacteria bacterium]|nr:DNA polymerase III subunit delta [Gammaproteobacteria bacterium]